MNKGGLLGTTGRAADSTGLSTRTDLEPSKRTPHERWVGTVRRECLDRVLIVGRHHLHHVIAMYVAPYNEHRPHRALEQLPPLEAQQSSDELPIADVIDLDHVRRRDLLGGLIHEYQLAA